MAIAAIMTAGSVTLISCNKEESSSSRTDTAEPHKKDNILSQQFVVAQDTDSILAVGDNLSLLFDKDNFLDDYEHYLQDTLQLNWVAEDVAVTVYELNESTIKPVLRISAYDVLNDVTENVFIFLSRVSLPNGNFGYSFKANINLSVTCTSGTNCERGCDPAQDPQTGEPYCTKCRPYPQAPCTKNSTAVFVQTAICRALDNVL